MLVHDKVNFSDHNQSNEIITFHLKNCLAKPNVTPSIRIFGDISNYIPLGMYSGDTIVVGGDTIVVVTPRPRPQTLHRSHDNLKIPISD